MGDLRLAYKKTKPSKDEVLLSHGYRLLYPAYALEPHEFDLPGFILKPGNKPLSPSFSQYIDLDYFARNLCIFILGRKGSYFIELGFINMPKRVMLQEVFECKNAQLFS